MSHRETILNIPNIEPAIELEKDVFFIATFEDNSVLGETECSWKYFSNLKKVKYQDGFKSVMVSKYSVKEIYFKHKGQDFTLQVPTGYEVYQAIRGNSQFVPSRGQFESILGRVFGLVKNDEVVEEYIMDNINDQITGWRK